ncbi:hypothetical protein FNF27_03293 [Cafeteria roenbergensis]|uniref:Uncharacterized protein n=1 Tax=Cafeteria roenbergensis TaxID=33653 RepID=A0A5A8EBR5_CAFRO|nr:hypothetical protein FNF27_03293 [Cafeteria roenbergensis]
MGDSVTVEAARAAFASAATDPRASSAWINAAIGVPSFWDVSTSLVTDPEHGERASAAILAMSRRAWRSYPATARHDRLRGLSNFLSVVATGSAGASATSIRFLAQALASAAALTSPEAVGGFIDLATGLGTGSAGHSGSAGGAAHPAAALVGVELIAGLATECLSRPHVHRAAVEGAVASRLPAVLATLEVGMAPHASSAALAFGAGSQPGLPAVGADASLALDALSAMALRPVTLASLTASGPSLLHRCAAALATTSAGVARAAGLALSDLASGSRDSSAATIAALDGLCAIVGSFRPRLLATMAAADADQYGSDAHLAKTLCMAASAAVTARLALPGVPGSARSIDPALHLLRSAMDSSCPAVLHSACEAWPAVAALPTSDREALLPGGGLTSILPALLRGCSLPETAAAWDEEETSAFNEFREQAGSAALQAVYTSSPAHFFASLGATLEMAPEAGWQTAEAVVFAARTVAMEAKPRLRGLASAVGKPRPSGSGDLVAELSAELEGTTAFLDAVFRAIAARSALMTAAPALVGSCCRLVASYAAWLCKRHDLVCGVSHFAITALQDPTSRSAAGAALSTLSFRAAGCLAACADPPIARLLVGGLEGTLSTCLGATLDGAAGLQLMEELVATSVRLCAALPADQMSAARLALGPVVTRLEAGASLGPLAVSRLVSLAGTAVRFAPREPKKGYGGRAADAAGSGGAAGAAGAAGSGDDCVTAASLAAWIWPGVATATASVQAAAGSDVDAMEDVSAAVGDAIGTIVRTAGASLGPALPLLVGTALDGFDRTLMPTFVEAVGAVCEQFGPSGDAAVHGQIATWLDRVMTRAGPAIDAFSAAKQAAAAAAASDASSRGLWGLVRASMAATAAAGGSPTDDACARALAEAFAAADYPTVTPDLSAAHRQAVARALLGLAVAAGDNEEEFALLAATMFGVARGKTGLEELASLLRSP